MLTAVKQNGNSLKYADKSLKKDKEIVLAAVNQDGYALCYADESLKKDKEIVLAAVKQDNYSFKFADKSLKKDKEFLIKAYTTCGKEILKWFDEELFKDMLKETNLDSDLILPKLISKYYQTKSDSVVLTEGNIVYLLKLSSSKEDKKHFKYFAITSDNQIKLLKEFDD